VAILEPLFVVVSAIMVFFHQALERAGLDPASGWAWGLSIGGLVVVIRILLIPLFVKQIKAQRGLQMLQPQIKKIQDKYKGRSDPDSKQRQSQEMMALYRETGTNPLASCLPIVAQAPIFFALFYVLNGIAQGTGRGVLDGQPDLVRQAADASIFGAPIASTFLDAGRFDQPLTVRVVTLVLIVLMSASTFITQKQLMTKNMPAAAMNNPFAQQQKILLYAFPVIFAVTGVNFPIGVLLYWLTTNIWSLGQQLYVIRRMPSPGSLADEKLKERRQKRERRHHRKDETDGDPSGAGTAEVSADGASATSTTAAATSAATTSAASPARPKRQQPKRQQPKKQSRDRRRR
jgi:YidC/Oxa1 family membrane protein insertase